MKKIISILFVLSVAFAYSQPNKIVIDTVEFNFKIKDIVDKTFFVPQIVSGVKPVVKERINSDLLNYFEASKQDSVAYMKELLSVFETIEEFIEFQKQETERQEAYYEEIGQDISFQEEFSIEYLSENLLCITKFYMSFPDKKREKFYFENVCYDLSNGNKLDFEDFFTISSYKLIDLFKSEGYIIMNKDNKYKKTKVEEPYWGGDCCSEFYFGIIENEVYLICTGEMTEDYGIPLKKMKPYIVFPEFKKLTKS